MTAASQSPTRTYDLIGFGDEVPGVLALVSASREFNRRTGRRPRILLMFKGNSQEGIGGHLVRGGLAYLDRSNVDPAVRQAEGLPTFGDPCAIYKEFLQRSQVTDIALDPRKADAALRQMVQEAGIDILSRVQISSVIKEGAVLRGIRISRGETYLAKQFIDATVNAELAQAAGVKKLQGFGTFGLPDSELPVTLVFETEGLSVSQLQEAELSFIRRFTNRNDAEAQRFITVATGNNATMADQFRKGMIDEKGNLKTMYVGSDHIDIRCRAFSIAYHSFRGKKFALKESGSVFDQANIARLGGTRLSWNALLCYVNGAQAEALARAAAKPTAAMLEEMGFVSRWIRSLGTGVVVRPATELYIRHAGNVLEVVEPLTATRMLQGGVPGTEALATFGYHLDVRGGITGLGARATQRGINSITFHAPPLFNVGIRHALLKSARNLAVVSPGSGFEGYACSAGRIVEFNVAVGQGVGIAAAIALLSNRNLADITNLQVRQVLNQTGLCSRIYGRTNAPEATRMLAFEKNLAGGTAIA